MEGAGKKGSKRLAVDAPTKGLTIYTSLDFEFELGHPSHESEEVWRILEAIEGRKYHQTRLSSCVLEADRSVSLLKRPLVISRSIGEC